MEELIDLVLLFQHLQPLRGRRVGLVGLGGGYSVLITDSCARAGLIVPSCPDELKRRLREILPKEVDPGTSVHNPVDLSVSGWDPDILSKTLETLDKYDGVDFILLCIGLHVGNLHAMLKQMIDKAVDALVTTRKNLNKPLAMVILEDHVPEVTELSFGIQEMVRQVNIPVFPSFNRGARAMSEFIRHYDGR